MKKIFLFIFLSYSIFFILFPPLQNPDEQGHYETVYWTSRLFYPYISPEFVVSKHPYGEDLQAIFGDTVQHAYVIPSYSTLVNSSLQTESVYSKVKENEFIPLSNQAYNPPVYYIVASLWLSFGKIIHTTLMEQFYITRLASAVFYFGTIFIFYNVLKKLYVHHFVVKGILLFLSLNPLFLQSGIGISPDIAVTFFSALFFYMVLTLDITKKKSLFLLGLIAGVGMLTKITAVFLVPSFLIFLLIQKEQVKSFVMNCSIFCLTVIITQTPWFVFNFIRYHKITVDTIALGIPPIGIHVSIAGAVVNALFDLRHAFMHYSGFVGWNESFPFPIIFIPFTVLFVFLLCIGLIKCYLVKNKYTVFLCSCVVSLLLFSAVLGFSRMIYYHPGWGIGGRNILPIFFPMVIFLFEGTSLLFRKSLETVSKWFYYFSLFYYFFILIFVLIPRYYV